MVNVSAKTVVIDIITQVIDKTSEGINKTTSRIDKLGDALKKTQKQADKLGKTKSELSVKDKATQVIQKINKSLKDVTKKAWNITLKALDKATAPIRGIFNLVKNPLVLTVSILGLSMGVQDTINTFANFEATMSKVKAISGATAEDMKILTAKAKEMGATTKFTATEAGEAFSYMAMAGWKTNEMLGGIEGVMNLAASSGEELGTVSDILTDAMTAFGLSASGTVKIKLDDGSIKEVANATHFADVMAAAASNSNTNVALLGESFKYCAPLAGQFKFSVEDTALALGLMANSGIKASNSGTAMRKILTQLSSDFEIAQANGSKFLVKTINEDGSMRNFKDILDDTRDAFKGMSQAEREALQNDLTGTANNLGIALSKENGELKTQAELYDEVMQAAQTMTDAGRVAEAEALAGKTAMAGLLAVVGASDEDYNKLADAVYNADGSAAKMAAIMMDNLQGDFILFQSAAEGVKIAFMEKLSPYLRSFVKWITGKMPDVSKVMEKVADKIGDAISNIQKKIQKFTSGNGWKNADFFGKISIAWDEIIAQPFSNWWNSTGNAWFAKKAGEIGNGIGEGLTAGLLALLGFSPQEAVGDGISIGASFAEGFMKGFDGGKIADAILNAIKNVFKDASKLLPGGEEASSTSWLSAALLAYGGMKIGKGVVGVGKGIASAGSLITGTPAATITGASLLGSAGAGTGILGLGANTAITLGAGNLAGGASLSAGALSAIGLGSIAGGVLGTAGLLSAFKDLKQGDTGRGVAKTGMVAGGAGAGAAIGTFLLPGVGTLAGGLIGAGIGGIGSLLTNKVWKTDAEKESEEIEKRITAEKEKQVKLYKNMQDSRAIREQLNYTNDSMYATKELYKKWNDIKWEINQGNLSEQEKVDKENEMKSILQELSNMYPNLISASDTENDSLKTKVDLIEEMNAQEKERLRMLLLASVAESKKHRSEDIENFENSKGKIEDLTLKVNEIEDGDAALKLGHLSEQYKAFEEQRQEAFKAAGNRTDSKEYKEAEINREFIKSQIDEYMSGFGVNAEDYKVTDFSTIISALDNAKGNLASQAVEEYKNYDLLKGSLQEAYEGELKLIELELGQSIDQAAQSFETMDVKQKIAFLTAIKKVQELNTEFDKIPDKKYMDIIVKYSTENGVTSSPEDPSQKPPQDPPSVKPDKVYATGGIINSPHIGLVGEAGPEAIIPLSGANKYRGIELWKEAGRQLGMLNDEGIYAHAQGGIFGDVSKSRKVNSLIYQQAVSNHEESDQKQTSSPISAPIDIGGINLGGINFTFNGSGNSDKENIMQTIREQMPEIANEVAEEIAKVLQKKFANMKAVV